jgi:hypothetical protein
MLLVGLAAYIVMKSDDRLVTVGVMTAVHIGVFIYLFNLIFSIYNVDWQDDND